MPPSPPFIRWGCCRNLLKRSSCWSSTVRSLAYTTGSHLPGSSSSDTGSHPLEKSGNFKFIKVKREGTSALFSFLRESKGFGSIHDLETYMSFIRLLCRCDWGDMDASSKKLVRDVIDNIDLEIKSFEISDHLFEALIEEKLIEAVQVLVTVYAKTGRFEEAIHAMSEMKRRSGVMVSTGTCNFVIEELMKLSKVDMVESVYRQMKGHGLIPNRVTYGMLIEAHCRLGCLEEAWDVFEQMEEAGVLEPDAFVYNKNIHGLCAKGKTDLAYQLVKKSSESNNNNNNNNNVFAYACVIRGFVKESRLQDAKDVVVDMKKLRGGGDRLFYDILIRGCCEKGEMDEALDVCKKMESGGIEKFDPVLVRRMMLHLQHLGMFDETVYVLKHFQQQSRLGFFTDWALRVSLKVLTAAACKLRKMNNDAKGDKSKYGSDDQKGENDHSDQKTLAGFQDHEKDEGVPDGRGSA